MLPNAQFELPFFFCLFPSLKTLDWEISLNNKNDETDTEDVKIFLLFFSPFSPNKFCVVKLYLLDTLIQF